MAYSCRENYPSHAMWFSFHYKEKFEEKFELILLLSSWSAFQMILYVVTLIKTFLF